MPGADMDGQESWTATLEEEEEEERAASGW